MSEIDKTIEELESEVLADLKEAEMKKDTSAAGKGGKSEAMDKVDGEVEDLGAPVVKGDEKKADAAKKVKQDSSVKSSQKGDQKADSVKEETETEEEEVVVEGKKLKEMGHKDEMAMPKTKAEMQDKMVNAMKKMKKGEMEGLYAMVMKQNDEMTDEEVELEGLAKAKEAIEKRLASITVAEDVDAQTMPQLNADPSTGISSTVLEGVNIIRHDAA